MQTLRLFNELLRTHPERRQAPRFFADFKVIMQVADDKQRICTATVLDYSSMGFRLRHNLELKPGEHVVITTPLHSVRARVVWSLESENGFVAGVVILPGEPVEPR